MRNTFFLLSMQLVCFAITAQKNSLPYVASDGSYFLLTWDEQTGSSKIYAFDEEYERFELFHSQLPSNPTGDVGRYGFIPYIDGDNLDCILTWNKLTGTSKLFYYDEDEGRLMVSKYQLPKNPTGEVGEFHFSPFVDFDGMEFILISNTKTGTNKLYQFDLNVNRYMPSPHKLPKSE